LSDQKNEHKFKMQYLIVPINIANHLIFHASQGQ